MAVLAAPLTLATGVATRAQTSETPTESVAPSPAEADPGAQAVNPGQTAKKRRVRRAKRRRVAKSPQGAVETAQPLPHFSTAQQEERHKVCLAFIQRHGLTCDPWQQPTCGYDLGYFRPLECVAP